MALWDWRTACALIFLALAIWIGDSLNGESGEHTVPQLIAVVIGSGASGLVYAHVVRRFAMDYLRSEFGPGDAGGEDVSGNSSSG